MAKELKSLRRSELIDIIYQLKKSEQALQEENERLRNALESKRTALSKAGSIAEAATVLTGIFTTAQETADIYLKEIEQRKQAVEHDYDLLIDTARKKADEIVSNASDQREAIIKEAKNAYRLLQQYEAMIEEKKLELSLLDSRQEL